MNVFVDTSAFLAVLDGSEKKHAAARQFWERIINGGDVLLCHNYIIPILHIIWVTREVHFAAVSAHIMADRRTLSLVDCVSFEVMRRTGIRKAFAFDRHFRDYGYEINPGQ